MEVRTAWTPTERQGIEQFAVSSEEDLRNGWLWNIITESKRQFKELPAFEPEDYVRFIPLPEGICDSDPTAQTVSGKDLKRCSDGFQKAMQQKKEWYLISKNTIDVIIRTIESKDKTLAGVLSQCFHPAQTLTPKELANVQGQYDCPKIADDEASVQKEYPAQEMVKCRVAFDQASKDAQAYFLINKRWLQRLSAWFYDAYPKYVEDFISLEQKYEPEESPYEISEEGPKRPVLTARTGLVSHTGLVNLDPRIPVWRTDFPDYMDIKQQDFFKDLVKDKSYLLEKKGELSGKLAPIRHEYIERVLPHMLEDAIQKKALDRYAFGHFVRNFFIMFPKIPSKKELGGAELFRKYQILKDYMMDLSKKYPDVLVSPEAAKRPVLEGETLQTPQSEIRWRRGVTKLEKQVQKSLRQAQSTEALEPEEETISTISTPLSTQVTPLFVPRGRKPIRPTSRRTLPLWQ